MVFKKSLLYCFLLIYLGSSLSMAGNRQSIRIHDIWTMQPLPEVIIIAGKDTLRSDRRGRVWIDTLNSACPTLILQKSGYFSRELSSWKQNKIYYLVPLDAVDEITVIAQRSSEVPLALPANITRISIHNSDRLSGCALNRILTMSNGLVIKSYGGSGQLQTISMRGMSAQQTQIMLDGIPLNSPQLGSADLGMYDAGSLESVVIYRGGNSILAGNGAIGGTINLHPRLLQNSLHYSLNLMTASFGNRRLSFRLNLPWGAIRQSVQMIRSYGKNDYSIRKGNHLYTLQNRDFSRIQWIHQLQWSVNKSWQISSYLSSFKHRGGSPKPYSTNSEVTNRARMAQDYTLAKAKIAFRSQGKQFMIQAYTRNEWMEYSDPLLIINYKSLHSLHLNQTLGTLFRGRWLVTPSLLVMGGGSWIQEEVHSTEAGLHGRQHANAYVNTDWLLWQSRPAHSLHFNFSLRGDRYSNTNSLLLPAAGLSLEWGDFRFFQTIGRNYRIPTFNDLYWVPGGNPQLKPEASTNAESGIQWQRLFAPGQVTLHVDGYYNRIKNLIRWTPASGYWQPRNIAGVLSKGVEIKAALSSSDERQKLVVNYTYGLSEKTRAEFPGDRTVGHQLPLLPREMIHLSLINAWHTIRSEFRLSRISFRYKSLVNRADEILPAFNSADWDLSISGHWMNYRMQILFRINNLFNEQYEWISGYPMPLRNFALGLGIYR